MAVLSCMVQLFKLLVKLYLPIGVKSFVTAL